MLLGLVAFGGDGAFCRFCVGHRLLGRFLVLGFAQGVEMVADVGHTAADGGDVLLKQGAQRVNKLGTAVAAVVHLRFRLFCGFRGRGLAGVFVVFTFGHRGFGPCLGCLDCLGGSFGNRGVLANFLLVFAVQDCLFHFRKCYFVLVLLSANIVEMPARQAFICPAHLCVQNANITIYLNTLLFFLQSRRQLYAETVVRTCLPRQPTAFCR